MSNVHLSGSADDGLVLQSLRANGHETLRDSSFKTSNWSDISPRLIYAGIVHSAEVTAANTHDSQMLAELMHGRETRLYGDSAYRGEKSRAAMREASPHQKTLPTNAPTETCL